MTNILDLPQLDNSPFRIVTNADFRDGVQFLLTVDPAAPLNIAGIAFRATIREASAPENVLISAATADGTMVADAANGVVRFALPMNRLTNLEPGDAIGDIVAEADGYTICLTKDNGPLPFMIRRGLI